MKFLRSLLLLPVVLTVPAHAALQGWWKFDEASGSTAADSSGQVAANGILSAGATFQPAAGKFGGAVYFNGTSGFVDAGDLPRFEFSASQSFTVACWYKSDGDETIAEYQTNNGLVSKGYGHATNGTGAVNTYDPLGYYQLQFNGAAGNPNSYFQFDSRQSSSANTAFRFPTAFPTGSIDVVNNNWHHFVVVIDRVAATPACKMYLDNALYQTKNIIAGAGNGQWAMGTNNSVLLFGDHLDRYTKGWMDDIGIWDEPLTLAQINAIYTNGIAGLGDIDNDGLADTWEVQYFGNTSATPSADPDNDGLTNLQEQSNGTNPTLADTDGDGLSDGAEVNTYLTNPKLADTDGDGLSDGAEVNTYLTHPKLADTDGDGFTDGEEITAGTNPLLASSHPPPAVVNVHINEFMSESVGRPNDPTSPVDMDGDGPDWLEIKNNEATTINLRSYQLSDDPAVPAKYVFPSVTIPAGGYLLVYCSGKTRAITGVQLHTPFKLSSPGVVLLSRPDGVGGNVLVSQIGTTLANYPNQRQTISYGRTDNTASGALNYFLTPTPGVANVAANGVIAFAGDTSFDVDRGLYSAPITVHITCATPGASIAYTVNGSAPTATNGTQVPPPNALTGPTATITIPSTTLLRARAFKTGLGPSNIDTQSYIFTANVMTQNAPTASMLLQGADTLAWGTGGGTPTVLTAFPNLNVWSVNQDLSNPALEPLVDNRFVETDLRNIATISVVADWKSLFGPNTTGQTDGGIYPPAAGIAAEGVDRVASFEMLNPAGNVVSPNVIKGFQSDGNIHIFGGTSASRWKSYKVSMRFQCLSTVKYRAYGNDGFNEFDNFILDGRINSTWMHPTDDGQRFRSDFVNDQVVADLQNQASGRGGFHNRPVHLYLNGVYWGVYFLHEKPDHHYCAAYYGGDSALWDGFKHSLAPDFTESVPLVNAVTVNPALPLSSPSAGNPTGNSSVQVNYEALLDLVGVGYVAPNPTPDLTIQANYDSVVAKLDIDEFIDYMLTNFVAGNWDWSDKNLYAGYYRGPGGGKWHFFSWDSEHTFRTGTENFLTANGNESGTHFGQPKGIHNKLKLNPEYRLKFADHVRRLMFNGGALSVANMTAAFNKRMSEIDTAIRGESARWGHIRASVRSAPNVNIPYKKADWLLRKNSLTVNEGNGNSLLQNRWNLLLAPAPATGSLRTENLYPTTSAPDYSQYGGAVPLNYALTITNPNATGTIYYTLDGSDPRLVGGAVSGTALAYSAAVILTTSGNVKSRVLDGTSWSALTDAYFSVATVPASAANLVISEINYNPSNPTAAEVTAGFADPNDFEYLELMNIGSTYLTLNNVVFTAGVTYHFNSGTIHELAPGQRVCIVENLAGFRFRYGNAPLIAGEFELNTNLSNKGERLTLKAADGSTDIQNFLYDNKAPWPSDTNGTGYTLVLVKPETNPNESLPQSWRASSSPTNGSPGTSDASNYLTWKAANAVSLDTGDVDADGVSNLLEYALKTDPNTNSASLPTGGFASYTVLGVPSTYLEISFTKSTAADDITYHIETATDLASWLETPCTRVSSTPHADGTTTEIWRTTNPVPNLNRAFIQLRVSYP